MKKILLDTNAYSNFLRGDQRIFDAIGVSDIIFFSVIVLGELFAGFKGGAKETENKNYLKRFIENPSVEIIPASEETAAIFGDIKHSLKSAGTPIPMNDVWIAAQAFETGSVLVTYDAHFKNIPGLRLWDGLT